MEWWGKNGKESIIVLMETPQQPQYQPSVAPQPVMPQSTHKAWVVPLVIVLILAGGYFALAKYQTLWPFSSQVAIESLTPSPTISPSLSPNVSQSPVSDLQTFNSKYFNVSFKYPKGYEVYDSQNYIAVANGKYQTYQNEVANGDNAFFQIQRFNQNYTKEQVLRNNAGLENPKLSKIFVDGSEFTKIEGEMLGGEVYQYGKTVVVVFDASSLKISQFTNGCIENVDCFAVGDQILATLKLSSTVNWKTYTNTRYGFEFRYPAAWLFPAAYIVGSTGAVGDSFLGQARWGYEFGTKKDIEGSLSSSYLMAAYPTSNRATILQEIKSSEQYKGGLVTIKDAVLTIAGFPAIRYDEGGLCGYPSTIIFTPSYTLKVVSNCNNESSDPFDQILSTLKFTQ